MAITDDNQVREVARRLASELDRAAEEAAEAGLVTAAYLIEVAMSQLRRDALPGSPPSVTSD